MTAYHATLLLAILFRLLLISGVFALCSAFTRAALNYFPQSLHFSIDTMRNIGHIAVIDTENGNANQGQISYSERQADEDFD